MKQQSIFKRIARFLRANPIILIFLLFFICNSIVFDTFFSTESIANLFRSSSTSGIVVIGMTLVILCSDIDLSVGAVQAMGGVIFALLVQRAPLPLAIGAAIAVGLVCGALTGLLAVKAKIPPFIASLSAQYAIRGAVYIITNQQAIKVRDGSAAFAFIGNGNVFGVLPVPAILDVYKRQPEYRARY